MLRARTLIATIVVALLLGGTADLAAAAAAPGDEAQPVSEEEEEALQEAQARQEGAQALQEAQARKAPPATKPTPPVRWHAAGEALPAHRRGHVRVHARAPGHASTSAPGRSCGGPRPAASRSLAPARARGPARTDRELRGQPRRVRRGHRRPAPQTPRPDGSWVTCETTGSERLDAGRRRWRGRWSARGRTCSAPASSTPTWRSTGRCQGRPIRSAGRRSATVPARHHVYPMDLVWLPPVESDWTFMCRHEGSFETGWTTSCRQTANRAGREVWEFTVSLTP